MTYYLKTDESGERFVKALANNGSDYSIASDCDPEPSGYTNHRWGDTTEWREISRQEATEIRVRRQEMKKCDACGRRPADTWRYPSEDADYCAIHLRQARALERRGVTHLHPVGSAAAKRIAAEEARADGSKNQ